MAENGSNINITASDRQARRTIASFFRSVEQQARRFSRVMGDTSPIDDMADSFDDLGDQVEDTFDEMEGRSRRYYDNWDRRNRRSTDTIGKQIRNLPEHLKPFHQALDDTRKHLRNVDRATVSFEEMSEAAVKSATSIQKAMSVSSSGKSAIKVINQLNHSVKETQMAVLGLNRDGTVKLSTEQTQERLQQFRREIDKTKEDLERLRDAGDFASYEAGMEVVERKLADVDRAMRAAARGGESYTHMLTELGVNTSDAMNRAAIAMEAYKDRWIRSIQMMEARKGQAQKMLEILPETSSIQRIDAFFLGIGKRLEQTAKQSTAASIALRQLGPNASMKDLMDRVTLINMGLMRMQQVALATGIAFAGFTAAMFNAAKGPSQADVFEERGKLLLEYQKQVQERTQEIVDTWSLFEKAEIEKTNPATLMKNLQGQVNIMKNWASNIDTLAKRGIDQGLLDSLRRMGPEAAGQIAALTRMSDSELNKYVGLWKEKHALARKEALTELEGLQRETSQKIKELENSLTPLGISLAKAQGVWAQALAPFVDIWGRIASKVVDASTAIGNFVIALNRANDDISQMGGMFAYLATGIALILSPMAIGIGRAAGMAAAFGFVWTTIGPLILGLTRIAGIASVLSAAIVVVVGSLMKMWGASENLRKSVTSAFTQIQNTVSNAIAPLVPALNRLKTTVQAALNSMVGAKAAGSFWQALGDILARVINFVVTALLPKFRAGLEAVVNFLVQIAPKVGNMVKAVAGFIKVLVDTVTNGNTVIGKIFRVVWTVIEFIIKSAWTNIKNIVTSGIAIITNLFQLFTNILQGNWKAAFGNLVAIVKNIIILIWNYINLMMLGRILGVFRSFFAGAITLFKSGWSKIHFNVSYFILRIQEIITRTYTRITTATGNAFKSMYNWARSILTTMYNFIMSNFQRTYNFYVNIMRRIYIAFMNGWNGVKSLTLSFLKSVWGFIQSYFKFIYNFYVNILRRIYLIFQSGWRGVFNITSSIFKSIFKFLSNIFSSIYRSISNSVSRTRKFVSDGWQSLWSNTKTMFGNIKKWVEKTYDDVVNGAKKLPSRIGQGIKSMSGHAKNGVLAFANTLLSTLGKGINGAISGINWVLGKIGVDEKKHLKKWPVPHYKQGTSEHPGGFFIAGDGGQEELIRFADGRITLSPPTDTLYYGDKGTEVLKGSDTKRLKDSGLLPFYESGVGSAIKKKAAELLGAAKSTAGKAKDKVTSTAKKAKDLSLDVWEYMSNPKELMTKVFANYIPSLQKLNGAFGTILSGSMKKVKDSSLSYIKKQMDAMLSFGGGGSSSVASYYLNDPFRITTRFTPGGNSKDKVHKGGVHKGLDLAAPAGTIIKSLTDGIVKQVIVGSSTAGNGVRIQSGKRLFSYIHMLSRPFVKLGEKIKAGQKIGKVGSTGFSTGNHLDLKVKEGSSYINPLTVLQQMAKSSGGGLIGKAGSGVKRWAGLASQALRMTGQYSKANLDRMLYQMQTESGGNPKSINLWDSNARRGTPSKGLMQVIDPTFRSYAMKGFNKNIYDPLSNMIASIRYSLSAYGSLSRAWKGHGYKNGGIINSPEIAALAENGKPEAVVPLVGRAMDPFAVGVAQKLGEIFNLNVTGTENGSPYVFQVNLNGRKVAEEVFKDIGELQKRSETRSQRARGEVEF